MKNFFRFFVALFVSFSVSPSGFALGLDEYQKRPKLVLVLVIDQFRADYLTRFGSQFLPAGSMKDPGGFRFLMKEGAYFPFAEYDVLQCMTCPGHAMILTGARPASFGFSTNDWFDRKTKKLTYCAEDAQHGLSPKNLKSTTVGDELKNIFPTSRVYAVSLKDRSAIMLGGHRADGALWIDPETQLWSTSSYYNKGQPPAWAAKLNEEIKAGPKAELEKPTVASATAGTEMILKAGLAALKNEKLGRGSHTDLLAISLSNHDILGHFVGPNAPEMEQLTLNEDKLLARFFKDVQKEMGGLQDVVIMLTADHGIPPTIESSLSFKLESGRFDTLAAFKKINERLDQKFGAAKKEWIAGFRLFHFFLNSEVLNDKKLNSESVENEIRKVLLEDPAVQAVFTRGDFDKGVYPADPLGTQIRHSYIPGLSGDIILIPKPFFYEKGSNNVTHMTGWSYDRTVPLIMVGRAFKPGVYAGALVIDLAPTLSFILGTLAPAMNEGRVLKEALR